MIKLPKIKKKVQAVVKALTKAQSACVTTGGSHFAFEGGEC